MITAATTSAVARAHPRVDGKFLQVEGRRFLVKGVAYGTFAPDADGAQFPAHDRVAADFAAIAAAGFNTVRTYTVPTGAVLDAAARHELRLMIGLPWTQHTAFLDDTRLVRQIRRDVRDAVRRLAPHPAALLFALGNEIPPGVVRWHGHHRVEAFLRSLHAEARAAAPESLLTYVNFPPTEYLDLECFDVCAFNVYLHREADLRAYVARLQHLAGARPLLLAEAGADSIREGADGQARLTAMQVRAAFEEGACGAVAFSWTDEWWRGGQQVDDWSFGLVDGARRPKAALAGVSRAFVEAPFPASARAAWPLVSVVVCAYNAEDTVDDCLASLARLTYPRVDVIVVDDGSRDSTASRARGYPDVRVLEVPHGGLSAARNAGLHAARGDIVAYTDADVRVDPDWLTYLVQPFLTQDVVGVGGPNIVPADDPWMAQCVARAPGGPTHVLIDDRTAEHVPGCNMAFRREALLAIGGFEPVFLRAGDDVDVCWRLQARNERIGFAPSALVWHHHRATAEGFWRQQVGYGEAEAWLHAHYPEKFPGGEMLWRGRIYSALPFVRALRRRRVNTGAWGTAAFPSVYWVGAAPWAFLPHSVVWIVLASTLVVVGALGLPGLPAQARWMLLTGAAAWLTTLWRCAALAWQSDLTGVPRIGRLPGPVSRAACRVVIAWLHLLQPLARARGRFRGLWSAPTIPVVESPAGQPWAVARPSFVDAAASGRLLAGLVAERAFWRERWLGHTALLSELVSDLRASRPTPSVEADDGWHADRDVSITLGRWSSLDARVLVEEHAAGRCLLRVGVRLRLRPAGIAFGAAIVALLAIGGAALGRGWLAGGAVVLAGAAAAVAATAWQTTRMTAVFDRALERVATRAALTALPAEGGAAAGPRLWPRPVSALRTLHAAGLVVLVALGLGRLSSADDTKVTAGEIVPEAAVEVPPAGDGSVAVGIAGDVYVADAQPGIIRRLRPRPPAGASWSADDIGSDGDPVLGAAIRLEGATDLAIAADGELYIADAARHQVFRVVPSIDVIETFAGSGAQGFTGDSGPAGAATLNHPSALAIARNGDVFVADTANDRIRMIARDTGRISTIAGGGTPLASGIGDGGPARAARLSRPMGLALSPSGDLLIADTGHHRIRLVQAATGIITTVAGDGMAGDDGDGGPAVLARLAGPTGLATAEDPAGIRVYIADSLNNRVRVIAPDGTIRSLHGSTPVLTPTRLAYHPAGWLYVKDRGVDGVTALAVPPRPAVAGRISPPRAADGERRR